MNKNKIPKTKVIPNVIVKYPKHLEPASCKDHLISWQFRTLDFEPSWSKKILNSEIGFYQDILNKLKNLETNTWNELERQNHGSRGKSKHHSVNISSLIKDAQQRLVELKLEDLDQLFSLRLEGKFRIWGIRESGYLKILWFDPDHEVFPTNRD